ncbi:MAG: DNA translocase FtsK 4TM domain-containing protein, partial [Candidatus Hydrogenedentota bacterium]
MNRRKNIREKREPGLIRKFTKALFNFIFFTAKNNEINGLILMGIGIVLFLTLVFNINIVAIKNSSLEYTGIIGSSVAYYLFLLLGWTAFLLPAGIFYTGYNVFINKPIEKKILKIIGIILALIYYSSLLSLLFGEISYPREELQGVAGGMLGAFVSFYTVKYFGKILGYLIIVFACTVSIPMVTPISLRSIWLFIREIAVSIIKFKMGIFKKLYVYIRDKLKEAIRRFNEANLRKIQESKKIDLIPETIKHQGTKAKVIKTEAPGKEVEIGGIEEKKTVKEIEKKQKVKDIIKKDIDEYQFPPVDLMNPLLEVDVSETKEEIEQRAKKLEETLRQYEVECEVKAVNRGPTVTQFEVQVTPGTKLSNLTARSGEIAYAMACSSVRIEAPIPGKTAIGI